VKLSLVTHPESDASLIESLAVEIARDQALLTARFLLRGAIDQLAIPAPATSQRRDGLWRHSCFEIFAGPAEGAGYCELNFAPSSQWAAYRFDDYRSGMAVVELATLSIACSSTQRTVDLSASFKLDWPDPELDWSVGLSAVIEARDGAKSYWALAHPPGAPDFHHADCFAARIAASPSP